MNQEMLYATPNLQYYGLLNQSLIALVLIKKLILVVIVFLGVTETDMVVLLAKLRLIYALEQEKCFLEFNWKCNFQLLIPKLKSFSIIFFYGPQNVNNFLETFLNDLKLTDFRKTEVYFLGDFNINLFVNDKFVLKENQSFDFRNLNSPLMSKYQHLCQIFSLKEIIQEPIIQEPLPPSLTTS